ncbi:DUF4302 domain-containing protein [Flavobacteriaceae bacterium]|nr:DUF4302 domain-containing protein [Flavobacteriaceae bacterium]
MNKILIKYSISVFAIVTLWSCGVEETESLFDETPTQRIESRITELRTLLLNETQGFSAIYYPDGAVKGGYNFHLKFNADLTVKMTSDIDAETALTTSSYDVLFGQTAELVFQSNNAHQTKLVRDADGGPNSEGGSNTFEYHSSDNGVITLLDVRNDGILELRPSGFTEFTTESVASANFTLAAGSILEGTSLQLGSRNILLDGVVIGQLSYDSDTRVATVVYTDANGDEQLEEVRMYITTTGITFFDTTPINGGTTSINGIDLLTFTFNAATEQYVADDNPNLVIDDLIDCVFDAANIDGTYTVSEMFIGGTNGGLQIGSAFGESYQVDIVSDPTDDTRILVTNSDGYDNFIIGGDFAPTTVFIFDSATGELSFEAGDPVIALFRFLSGAGISLDVCSEQLSFTGNGQLGEFGFYEFVFTKQ